MSAYHNEKQIISFRSALILAALIALAYTANSVLVTNQELRMAISDVATVLIGLLVTLGLLNAANRSAIYGRQVRLAWTVLALAQFSQAIGDIIWAIEEVVLHQSPFPSLADVPYLAYYPIFALGILLLPRVPLTSSEKLKVFLDTGIVMIASNILFWVLLIAPTIQSSVVADNLTTTLAVAYTIDNSTPETIMGDPTRLRQILANLISNAVKFTNFGKVEISSWARVRPFILRYWQKRLPSSTELAGNRPCGQRSRTSALQCSSHGCPDAGDGRHRGSQEDSREMVGKTEDYRYYGLCPTG